MELVETKKDLLRRLTQLSNESAAAMADLGPRSLPKTKNEEMDLIAACIPNDLVLQQLLLLIPEPKRYGAYDALKPRLRFRPRKFEEVMGL